MGPQGSLEQVLAAAGGGTGMGRVQAERPGDHYSGWVAGWWLDPGSSYGWRQVEKFRWILECNWQNLAWADWRRKMEVNV